MKWEWKDFCEAITDSPVLKTNKNKNNQRFKINHIELLLSSPWIIYENWYAIKFDWLLIFYPELLYLCLCVRECVCVCVCVCLYSGFV